MVGRVLRTAGEAVLWVLKAILSAIRCLDAARGLEAAATIAFFTLFSLFPFLLLLVAAGGTALKNRLTDEQILDTALRFLPVSRELIHRNLIAILDSRGTVGIIGGIGLLWASTSVFTSLTHNLNRAWPEAPSRGIVKTRLTAVLQVLVVVSLMTALLVAQTLLHLPEEWRVTAAGGLKFPLFAANPLRLIFSFCFVGTLILLYWWVPNVKVRWRAACGGAAVASLTIYGATSLFVWYLGSGLARYNLVYGSLGTFLALMTWAYIVSLLVLYGAHLSASFAGRCCRSRRERLESELSPPGAG